MLEWERICKDTVYGCEIITERINVPGGWIVKNTTYGDKSSESMCFMPDKNHTWGI